MEQSKGRILPQPKGTEAGQDKGIAMGNGMLKAEGAGTGENRKSSTFCGLAIRLCMLVCGGYDGVRTSSRTDIGLQCEHLAFGSSKIPDAAAERSTMETFPRAF